MRLLPLFLLLSIWTSTVFSQQSESPVAPDARLKKLAGGFSFTEGPAADPAGNVYFTDQPNNRIHLWSTDGKLSVFSDRSGRSNGMYFDPEGRLVACADMKNELWRFDSDGGHEVLLTDYEGKLMNGPNDVWIRPDGGMYLTDPMYERPYWDRDPAIQQAGEFVYYFSPEKKKLIPVDQEIIKPNGIVGHPQKNLLYVADIRDRKTYVYRYRKNGKLSGKKLFTEMGSDGMTIDARGNIYLTGKGVTIFNPDGEQIGHIDVPENWSSNVCFGGKDFKTLFITASESFYSIEMQVPGLKSY